MILLLPVNLFGQVILSEVLSNEPQGRVNLEWVEIVNTSDTFVDLAEFSFVCGQDTTYFPTGSTLGGHEFAILARRLAAPDGGDSFEGHWGDSSGYWGDGPGENYFAFQADMRLGNDSGAVYLINTFNMAIDSFVWQTSSFDGISLERDPLESTSNTWRQCLDRLGSTPGLPNSGPFIAEGQVITITPRLISYRSGVREFQINCYIPNSSIGRIEIYDDAGRKKREPGDRHRFRLDIDFLGWRRWRRRDASPGDLLRFPFVDRPP